MAKKKKKKRQRRSGATSQILRFAPDAAVRVKAGTMDSEYPDIPIGGWSGIVADVGLGDRGQVVYLIEWNRYTLEHMPAVYRSRCERDGFDPEQNWMFEVELEADTGETRVMEQPAELQPDPLNPNSGEDRVRAIFGLTSDDPLPEPDAEALRLYRRFLTEHLRFPFSAYSLPLAYPDGIFKGEVTGLSRPEDDSVEQGILCTALEEGKEWTLPLAVLVSVQGERNRRLVQDYSTWFMGDAGELQTIAETMERKFGRDSFLKLFEEGTAPSSPIVSEAQPEEGVEPPGLTLANTSVTLILSSSSGFLLGSTLTAVPWAWIGASVAAGVTALVTLIALFYKPAHETRLERQKRLRLMVSMFPVIGMGASTGAAVVTLVVAYLGTLVGGLLGTSAGLLLLRRKWPHFAGIGAMVGALVLTWIQEPWLAWQGAWMGAAIGAAGGLLLTLASAVVVRFFPEFEPRPN